MSRARRYAGHHDHRRTPERADKAVLDKGMPVRCPDCGKLCYSTRKLVAAAMSAYARNTGQDKASLNYYRCKSGNGWWHYGHVPGWRVSNGLPTVMPPRNGRLSHDE